MFIPIDPNKQVYSEGVASWIKTKRYSPDLFSQVVSRQYLKMPDVNSAPCCHDSRDFFRVTIADTIFWVKTNYADEILTVMLPEEYKA